MGRPTSNHRPLRAGIAIMPSAGEDHRGTLGAIARRKSDLAKVIVTAVHVVSTHRNNYNVNGTEFIYQGGTAEGDKVGQLFRQTIDGAEKKSWVEGSDANGYPVDAAALLIPANVQTSYDIHFPNDDDDDHTHLEKWPIVGPAVSPTPGMRLIAVGAASGQRDITVLNLNPSDNLSLQVYDRETGSLHSTVFFDREKNFTTDQQDDPSSKGDSGSPVLWVDEHGNYRIVGIHFGGDDKDAQNRSRTGFVSRASAIEEELGITFGVKMPIAEAGQPKTVLPGAWFMLDGNGSRVVEPNAGPLEYYWKAPDNAPQPPSSTLLIPPVTFRASPTLGFTAPRRPGDYLYKLTVKDTNGAKHSATVTVTVAPNNPPTATAGADKTAYRGETVELNGSGNDANEDTLTYQWEQLGLDELGVVPVTPVTITNADQANASFVAPNQIGALSFKLTVTDSHGASHSDTVTVTVQNRNPIAYAGPNKVITVNNRVTLEGSVSDPDPADRSYVLQHHTWSQDSGPETVTLSPVAAWPARRTFTPRVEGIYNFTLTATDQEPLSASDTVRVSVWPSAQNLLPTRVSATAAARSVALGWTGPSIATGYEVEIGIPPSAGGLGHTSHTTTGTSITIGSLTPQQTYEYRVRMTNADGVGPWTGWATVVTPGETPPKPTGDQWDVQYLNNKIQVKLTELPVVIPAISQVKAFLGTGEEPDLTTVEKEVGTTLNQWVDVLESSETDWRTGRWLAQIRFVNSAGSSHYSTGKPVTVPNNPPKAFAGYNDIVLPNTTVYLRGSSKDSDRHPATEMAYNWSLVEDVTETPGRSTTRVPQVTPLITIASPTSRRTSFTAPAQAQTLRIRLTVTDPNGATDTDDVITQVHSGVGTTEWLDTRATRGCGATRDKEQMRRIDRRPHGEYRWAADPEEEVWSAWEDTDRTRNRNEGDWTDTDPLETMGEPPDVEKKQTRTITWEQEQTRTSETCGTIEPQWLEASETETRWVVNLPGPWEDVDPPVCQGCGPTKEKKQQRDNNGVTEYQWLAIPEPLVWTDWEDVVPSETRNRVEGDWEDTGRVQTDPVIDVDEKEQTRTITYDKRQRSANQCDGERFSWLGVSETQTRWVEGRPDLLPTSVPNNITADPSARSVDISWDPVARATGYGVEIGIPASAGGLGHTSDTTTGRSITIGNLLPLQTYEYRVQATNTSGDGPWSDWATVVTSREDLPTPTNDQWNIEYDSDNNRIQAKVISLPAVNPAISEARVSMEIGQPPNLVTVTKVVGVSLDTWVDVLTSADTQWQSGTWVAHLRFENSVGNSAYSSPGRPVTVPAVPPPPPPVTSIWVDTGQTRDRVEGNWTDTGRTRENLVTLIVEKEQRRTVTWEKKQIDSTGNVTEPQWIAASRVDTQWVPVPDPPPTPTNDQWGIRYLNNKIQAKLMALPTVTPAISQARVHMETGQPPNLVNITKVIGTTLNTWVTVLSSGDTGWATGVTWVAHIRFENSVGNSRYSLPGKSVTVPNVTPPPPPVTHSYRDITPAVYSGCGPNRRRKQECIRLGHEDTRWRSASEPLRWGDWRNVDSPVIVYGSWRNVGSPQLISGTCKQRKERSWTRSQRQQSRSHCGGTKFQSVTTEGTEFNYDTVSETWGSWTDTGRTREHPVELIVEKEQERFSSPCSRRQTQWVIA